MRNPAHVSEGHPWRLTVSHLADASDPLEGLDGRALPHATYEPVARLLVTERLMASRASHIDVAFGPPRAGARRVAVSWMDPRAYPNEEPTGRRIEGEQPLSARRATPTTPRRRRASRWGTMCRDPARAQAWVRPSDASLRMGRCNRVAELPIGLQYVRLEPIAPLPAGGVLRGMSSACLPVL